MTQLRHVRTPLGFTIGTIFNELEQQAVKRYQQLLNAKDDIEKAREHSETEVRRLKAELAEMERLQAEIAKMERLKHDREGGADNDRTN